MNVSEAIQLFLNARRNIVARQTLRNNDLYLRSLLSFLGTLPIETLTLEDLRRWRASLYERSVKYEAHNVSKPVKGKLSVYTIKGHVEAVRQLFNWLVAEEYLEKSPAKRLEIPKLPDAPPRSMSDCDLEKLIQVANETPGVYRRKRNVALLLFLRDTGARIGGASSLRFEHLDLAGCRALVTEKGRGGGKTRTVFFKEETRAALLEWIAVHPGKKSRRVLREHSLPARAGEFVFVGERFPYEPLSTQSIYCVFKALKKKAGLTGRTNPHGMRHRRAKTLLQNGAPLGLVSRILGHSDVRVTDRFYGVYADEELKQGYDRYA